MITYYFKLSGYTCSKGYSCFLLVLRYVIMLIHLSILTNKLCIPAGFQLPTLFLEGETTVNPSVLLDYRNCIFQPIKFH